MSLDDFFPSLKSLLAEVRAELTVALDAGLIEKAQFDSLYKMQPGLQNLIAELLRYLSGHVGNRPQPGGHNP